MDWSGNECCSVQKGSSLPATSSIVYDIRLIATEGLH
jgi:hypothetical protein